MRYYRSLLFTLLGPRSRREKRINGAIQPRVKTIEQNVAILNRRGQSCRRTQATIDNDPPPRCPILPTNWPSCPTILSTTIIITLMTTIILTINRMTRILMQVGSFFHKYFFFNTDSLLYSELISKGCVRILKLSEGVVCDTTPSDRFKILEINAYNESECSDFF